MKNRKYQIGLGITAFLMLISIVVLYVTHKNIPFMMDDLWYATMLSSETPITSLADIVESQIWHYNNWGGRSITHSILQLTLLAGEHAADLLNVIMTLLLSGMICKVAGQKSLLAYFAAFGMLFGLNANWKMSMFWQAGAANYLYITVFILLYLHCYLRECELDAEQRPKMPDSEYGVSQSSLEMQQSMHEISQSENRMFKDRRAMVQNKQFSIAEVARIFGMILLGIMAGWSNENMGPAVWIVSLLVILLKIKQKQKIKLWMILGNIACLCGSILVIAAPGNFVRSGQVAENQYGLLWRCFWRGYAEAQAFLVFLFPTLLILMFMLALSKVVLKQTLGIKNVLLLLGALLSWGAMVLSPHYPDRATFGTMVLLICVILSLAGKVIRKRQDLGGILWWGSVLVWLRGMYYLGEYLAICWGWIR